MASLLERAALVREQLREKEEIASIPEEEREQIYREIDKAVASNRLRIRENTFTFHPEKSDKKLPLLVNVSAFLLIGSLTALSFYFFNRAENSIVRETETISSAESALIETIREESEQKISEKEQEIRNIRNRLEEMRNQQESLKLLSAEEVERREADLRDAFNAELEAERDRLQSEGYNEADIAEKLRELEAEKKAQFDRELNQVREEMEQDRLARENEIAQLISTYEEDLQSVQAEQAALEENLRSEIVGERDRALNTLEEISREKEQESFVLSQITTLYSNINRQISSSRFSEADESLDALESFLSKESASQLEAVQFRKEIDDFMIESLRKLVSLEVTALESAIAPETPVDTEEESDRDLLLAEITNMVDEGNNYYEEGQLAEARQSYIEAISHIPALESGFAQLELINKSEIEKDEERFRESVQTGEDFFRSGDMDSAVSAYKSAMAYLTDDETSVSRIVNRLVEAGLTKELSEGKSLVSASDLSLIGEAKLREQVIINLMEELQVQENHFQDELAAISTGEDSTDKLISLLGTKLLIKEVLSSESIREQYPDLSNEMDNYLQAYGEEMEKSGKNEALAEIVELTEKLKSILENGA